MHQKSQVISQLELLYKDMGNDWVQQNSYIFNIARKHDISIGGSIAMSIANKKPHKVPGDIDLFTDNNTNAMNFLNEIMIFLSDKEVYYQILINNNTRFCLDGVSNHFKIKIPFWLSICVMTLKNDMRFYYWHGIRVQTFNDVVLAAKTATLRDNKKRDPDEYWDMIDDTFENHSTHSSIIKSTNESDDCILFS